MSIKQTCKHLLRIFNTKCEVCEVSSCKECKLKCKECGILTCINCNVDSVCKSCKLYGSEIGEADIYYPNYFCRILVRIFNRVL